MKISGFAMLLMAFSLTASAQSTSVMIEDLTWPEIHGAIAAGKTTAIYYAGSAEQNGPHMAIGKHNFIAQYAARRIAEELGNALAYPVMPYALTGDPVKKTGHMRFPGSVSLSPGTFGGVARETAESAISAGFRNVFLMGDHGGGQDVLKKVAADLDARWAPKGIRVRYVPDVYYKSQEQVDRYLKEHGLPGGAHAGIPDTAEVMFLDHDKRWIRRDKLAPGDKTNGVDGDPRQATPEMGKLFIQYKIDAAVAQIRGMVAGKE